MDLSSDAQSCSHVAGARMHGECLGLALPRVEGLKHFGLQQRWDSKALQALGLPEGPPQELAPAGLLPDGGWLLKPDEYVVPEV